MVSYHETREQHDNRPREMRTLSQELARVLSPVIVGPCQIPHGRKVKNYYIGGEV